MQTENTHIIGNSVNSLIPKFSDYRKEIKDLMVEVQFRTISMDWWASLEHKIRYKKDVIISDEIAQELSVCAEAAATLDARMEKINQTVDA